RRDARDALRGPGDGEFRDGSGRRADRGPQDHARAPGAARVPRDERVVPHRAHPGAARGGASKVRRANRAGGGSAMTTRAVQYDFSGKVVVITGGSRGLGHAMALGFAAAGARLAIASRKLEACEATVKEIRALGSDGSAHAAHVGKWAD